MERYVHKGFQIHHICEASGRHKGEGKEFHAVHYNSSRLPFDLQMGPYRSREDTRKAIDRFLDGLAKFLKANNVTHNQPRYKKEVRRYLGLCMRMDSHITLKKSIGYAENFRYKDPIKLQKEKGEISEAETKKMIAAIQKQCAAHTKKVKADAAKHQKKIDAQIKKDKARWKKEEKKRKAEKKEREERALNRFKQACELTQKRQTMNTKKNMMTAAELREFNRQLREGDKSEKKVQHANT